MKIRQITQADWLAEGERRFGPLGRHWKFVCPICGHVASVLDFVDRGGLSPERAGDAATQHCLGRYLPGSRRAFGGSGPGPCDYTAAGLFQLAPVHVTRPDGRTVQAFEFAAAIEEKAS